MGLPCKRDKISLPVGVIAKPVVVSFTGWNELVVTALLAEEAKMGGLFLAATYVTDLTACTGCGCVGSWIVMGPLVVCTVVVGDPPICARPVAAGCSRDWSWGAAVAVDIVVTLVTGVRFPGNVAIGAAWKHA